MFAEKFAMKVPGARSSLILSLLLLMFGFVASNERCEAQNLPSNMVAQADASQASQKSESTVEPAVAPSFRSSAGTAPVTTVGAPLTPSKSETGASNNFVPFTDPMQNAFALMVPEQYKVKGGMHQYGQTDHRADLHISAPDNTITLFMGDIKLAPYATPDPKLTKHGFKDQTYELRAGIKMLVKPYDQAPKFLSEYGPERLRRNYENVLCDGVRNQPALASGIYTIYQQGPPPAGKQEFTAADAHFHLMSHGKPMVGYVILVCESIYGYGPGMWKVPYVWGYVSTPEQESRAKQYLAQSMNSLQMTPEWIDKTSNKNGVVGLIIAQVTHAMASTVNGAP